MSNHDPTDPICPASEVPGNGCLCAWLKAARADERERIAQAIEATAVYPRGAVTVARFFALGAAARIARSGGRDE